MCSSPSAAMVANHSSITGPKNLPMPAVPCFWNKNSRNNTSSVSGMTYLVSSGDITSSPSMAPSTVIAGVMTPSP